MKKPAHKKRVVAAIRLAFESLDSHLDLSTDKPKKKCETCGTQQFHAKAIKEYAFIIDVLSDCL